MATAAHPTPIHLVAREVALAAKAAFDEGRLSAQGPTPKCAYRDPTGHPCAIGAALNDATATLWDDAKDADGVTLDTSVEDLLMAGLLSTDDIDRLAELQQSHDLWAQRAEGSILHGTVEEKRDLFLAALNAILVAA